MMTQSELSIIIKAIDEASANINKVKSELDGLRSEAQTVNSSVTNAGNGMAVLGGGADKAGDKTKKAGNSLKKFGNQCNTVSMAMSGLFGSVTLSKISDMTIGLALQRQQMVSLTGSIMGSRKEAEALYNQMDRLTNESVIDLDSLARSMNTIKMSTKISNDEMRAAVDVVNHVGEVAYLQGFRGQQLTEKMSATLNGLAGEWKILRFNFGVTEQELKKLGWSGAANDVKGYIDALDLFLTQNANVDGALDSTAGRIAILEKKMRIAGRQIGEAVLPLIDGILSAFIALDPNVQKFILQVLIIGGAIIGFLMVLAPVLYSLAQLGTVLMALTGAETVAAAVTTILGAAFTFLTGPVGIAILAIIAIALALLLAYKHCKPFREWVDKTVKSIKDFIKRLMEGKVSAEELGRKIGWLIAHFIFLPLLFYKIAKKAGPYLWKAFEEIGRKIQTELGKIPDRIRAALPAAIRAAISFGKGIINGILGAMGIHSPGIIQNSIVKEVWDTIKGVASLKSKARAVGAGFGSALSNSAVSGSANISGNLTRYTTSNHKGVMELKITHDLKNAPAGTDEQLLADMINTSEDNVLVRAIAKNGVFQAIDKRVKENDVFSQRRSVGL